MSTRTLTDATHVAHEPERYSRHFYSLDALRGLAALGIVFFHWQHFFYAGTKAGPFEESRQPLYLLFRPLYTDGARAVDLFFCLSGFIFFWLYSERIKDRVVSLKEFAVLRFSRPYPLHFLTLLFVAAGQMVMLHFFGSYFVYPDNDLYHFALQLIFASNWGFASGFSFNGPIWSVSVEVLLYAIFFAICFLRFNQWWQLVLLACLSVVLARFGLVELSRGVLSFFVGGLSYQLFLHMWRRGLSGFQLVCLVVITILLWIDIPLNVSRNTVYEFYQSTPLREFLSIHHKDLVGALLLILGQNSFEVILFPTTLLTLACCEAFRGTLGKGLAFLGNISYSVYLLHFPLQLVFMFGALALSLPNTIFYSPWLMVAFFGLLILLSLCSFHFLERPAQKILRAKLL